MRDSGKCILCGLCVRVCSQVMGVGAIGLAGRGFTTVVSPEFYKSLGDSQCISCGQCVSLCPTGALVEKVPFQKDVPLREICTATHCTGCAAEVRDKCFFERQFDNAVRAGKQKYHLHIRQVRRTKLANVEQAEGLPIRRKTISLERAAEIYQRKQLASRPPRLPSRCVKI